MQKTSSTSSAETSIFIGGLTEEVGESALQDYCSTFGGPLTKCQLMKDPKTGRSRRFAFVQFKSRQSAEKFLTTQPHYIGSRIVVARPIDEKDPDKELPPSKRAFVCCTEPKESPISESSIFEYLGTFGHVKGVIHQHIAVSTSSCSRYWIVEFSDVGGLEKCLAKLEHVLNNVRLSIRKVLSRQDALRMKQANAKMKAAEEAKPRSAETLHPKEEKILRQHSTTSRFPENIPESAKEYVAAPILSGYGYTAKRSRMD